MFRNKVFKYWIKTDGIIVFEIQEEHKLIVDNYGTLLFLNALTVVLRHNVATDFLCSFMQEDPR